MTQQTRTPGLKQWPHAPVHQLAPDGVYMVTAATLYKEHLFKAPENLSLVEDSLLALSQKYEWQLEAWAVFSNHYHFVARGQPGSDDLGKLIRHLHADTARELNRLDNTAGRQVWFNFWDTRLTYEHSYFARLQLRSSERSETRPSSPSRTNTAGVRQPGSSGLLLPRVLKRSTRLRSIS